MKNNIIHKVKKEIKKTWDSGNNGTFATYSDSEVLKIFNIMGIKVPMKMGKSVFVAKVFHDISFNLLLFIYSDVDGDSGWVGYYVERFLTVNKVNLGTFAEAGGFDTAEMCFLIGEQSARIAREKNLPISIGTIFDNDFSGVVETDTILNNITPKNNLNRN